jgi:hypothetical protein
MIVNWDFYVRRKRLNVKVWLERKNIKDYNCLVEVTKKLGIETPPEEKVSKYFEKPEIKKNDKKIKKHVPKRTSKPASKPAVKIVDVAIELHKKIETDSVSGVSDKKQQTKPIDQEKPKQTRKRKPRKKRQSAKKED